MRLAIPALGVLLLFSACRPNETLKPTANDQFSGRLYAGIYSGYNEHPTTALTFAEFFNPVVGLFTPRDSGTTVFIGSAKVNGFDMSASTAGPGTFTEGYYDGQATNADKGMLWEVNGSNGIASFSHNDQSVFPDFFSTLPDSISLSKGVTFSFLAGTTIGADTVIVIMDSKPGAVGKGSSLPGSISFSPSDMAQMISGDTAYINLILQHHTVESLSGQSFVFFKNRKIIRAVPIR